MRAFYLRHILAPLFMFQVNHLPLFLDYCHVYVGMLQKAVHGKLLTPDYIEQAREELARIPPVDKRK
jgi:hypothetical protein